MERSDKKDIREISEEVQDIIDRMPNRTGILVVIILIFLTGFLIFFGLLIEYPETVSGPVSITARQAPVRLVANSSGKLRLLIRNSEMVKQGKIFAYIENTAILNDVLKIREFLENNSPDMLFTNPALSENNLCDISG